MASTTEARSKDATAGTTGLHFTAMARLGIPALLLCSCASAPVKHYTLVPQGAAGPAAEAIFRATEKPAIKPFVRIDGRQFSVGSELEGTVLNGIIRPFAEPQMRSLEVRLAPGHHKIEVAISYMGRWSLPFSRGRTIEVEAAAGKTYELKVNIVQFNDYRADGNIEWGTKVIEVETQKEFASGPDSPRQL